MASKLDKLIDKLLGGKNDAEPDHMADFNRLVESKAEAVLTAKLEAYDKARRSPLPQGKSPAAEPDDTLLLADTEAGAKARQAVIKAIAEAEGVELKETD